MSFARRFRTAHTWEVSLYPAGNLLEGQFGIAPSGSRFTGEVAGLGPRLKVRFNREVGHFSWNVWASKSRL